MPTIANGSVSFDTVAREWRCKFSGDAATSTSLEAVQKLLEKHLPALKDLGGEVVRQVCGGCLDFKVSTALPVDKFTAWQANEFSPEAEFLEELKKIEGVSAVETQNITFMKM